jgi:chromosome partitioning protein
MTAHVIAMIGYKGGVGRTTVGVLLAGSFARRHLKVVIIDAHAEGSASRWMATAPDGGDITCVFLGDVPESRLDLVTTVKENRDDCDVIIIDCSSDSTDPATDHAAECADLVLAPMPLGAPEVWSAPRVVDVVRRARAGLNPELVFGCIVNKATRTKVAAMCLQMLKAVEGLPLLRANLTDRKAYREVSSIVCLRDKVAIEEVNALTDEVLELLDEARRREDRTRVQSGEAAR